MSEPTPDPKLETPAETAPEAPKPAAELPPTELEKVAGGGWPNVYVYTGGAGGGPI